MPGKTLLRTGARMLTRTQPSAGSSRVGSAFILPVVTSSSIQTSNISSMRTPSSTLRTRPRMGPSPFSSSSPFLQHRQRRTLFIRTEATPNRDALKFLPGIEVKPTGISSPFIEYLTPRSTIAPPYPSPLASKLMAVDGVTSVFYGADFITVTKAEDANWDFMKPEIFALVTEAVTAGEKLVNIVEKPAAAAAGATVPGGDTASEGERSGEHVASEGAEAGVGETDSLAYNENDSEVVGMIKELLETRIRPTIQQDGGDIEFVGFEGGQVMLKLRGACRTCDSSTATLQDGIEKMLTHYIEEVEGVQQVLDKEEEISVKEFAKFEEKLKTQGGIGWEKMY